MFKMRVTFGKVIFSVLLASLLVILFTIITNCYLTSYELEEKLNMTRRKFGSLNSYFNKFENMSFPIKYSLKFYEDYHRMPLIYVITPTNNRAETQLADLTRMRNTLWLVPKLVWIVVEDSSHQTYKMKRFLADSQIEHVHLNEETTSELLIKPGEKEWSKPRGVLQRNKALQWLRDNSDRIDHNGVVYFADDDNTYDLRLFEEIRSVRKVGVWPVAFVGELMYERPVCKDGKVIDWFVAWADKRPFPMDMAGFAIHLSLILAHPSARFSQHVPRGMQESHLLSHLVRVEDLEAKADNCTKIYVWHTNTRKILRVGEKQLAKKNITYDLNILSQV